MISRPEEARGSLVCKWPQGAVPAGEQLSVGMDEVAVFVGQGRVLGALGPGRHGLDPAYVPFLASAGGAAEVFFVSTQASGIAFGGAAGAVADPRSQVPVAPRLFGNFSVRVTDPPRLVAGLLGAGGDEAGLMRHLGERVLRGAVDALGEAVAKGTCSQIGRASCRERV
jgi:membrane protease subunit (stomatin/prohibitin family)